MAAQEVFSGDKLRARRKAAKLSRDVLAVSVGVVTDTVGNWERGYCTPRNTHDLTTLADRLGCSVADFFEVIEFDD